MQQKLVNANAVREKGFVKEANPVLKTFIGFLSSQPHQKQHHLDPPISLQLSIPELRRNEIGLVKKKSWSLLKKNFLWKNRKVHRREIGSRRDSSSSNDPRFSFLHFQLQITLATLAAMPPTLALASKIEQEWASDQETFG